MALLTVQKVTSAGITLTFAAADVANDTFANDGKVIVYVKNGGVGSINVTLTSSVTQPPAGTAASNTVIAVANGSEKCFLIPPTGFNNPTTGVATLAYSGVTSVTVAVISVGA
jgi:hypothetical protein